MVRARFRGDFFPTLEDALLEVLAQAKGADPLAPVTVLCPTALLRQHLALLIASRTGGSAALTLTTLGALGNRLGGPALARRGLRAAPRLGAELALARAGREGLVDGTPLASIARTAGFGAAASQTVRDLREAGLDPSAMRKAGREDLARLLEAQAAAFSETGWADGALAWQEAARAAVTVEGTVVLYGFYDLTAHQWAMLQALCEGPRDVFVCVPDGPAEAFRFGRPFQRALDRLGFVDAPAPVRPSPLPPALARLRGSLFEPPAGLDPIGTESLRIVGSPGGARQAREIARAVLDAVRELDVPLREVAILHRASDELVDPIVEALDAAGVASAARGAATCRLPAFRALELLRAVRQSGLGRSALAELFTSGLLEPAALVGADATGAYRPFGWDTLTRRLGIVTGAAPARARLEAHVRRLERRLVEEDAPRWRREIEGVRALSRALETVESTLADWPERATLDRHADALQACGALVRVGLDGPAEDPLDELRALAPVAGEVGLPELERIMRRFGAEPVHDPHRLGDGRVIVQELMSARGVPFDVVVVANLAERVFPGPPPVDPLLPDGERRRIAAATGRPLAAKIAAVDEERTLFRLAVGAARRRLVLTYPRLDPSRDTVRAPSIYVLGVLEAIEGRPVAEHVFETHPALERVSLAWLHPRDPARLLDDRERMLFDLERARVAADPRGAARALRPFAHARAALELEVARWRTSRLTAWDGRLVSPEARAFASRALAGAGLSASRLELWASCPFRFLLGAVLGLEKQEEPELRWSLEPIDRGILVHRILQRAVEEELAGASYDPARLRAIAAEELDREERLGAPGHPLLWQAERRRIEEDVVAWQARRDVAHDGLVPRRAEAVFGRALDGPEVLLDAGPRVLSVLGRIDRVDVTSDGRRGRVVDYKTGALKAGLGDDALLGGRALQLAIYVRAAQALEPQVEHWTAEFEYLSGEARGRRIGWDAGPGGWRLGALEAATAAIVEGIEAGLFLQEPTSCGGCDFKTACPVVDRIAPRKRDDPHREPFDRLRAVP